LARAAGQEAARQTREFWLITLEQMPEDDGADAWMRGLYIRDLGRKLGLNVRQPIEVIRAQTHNGCAASASAGRLESLLNSYSRRRRKLRWKGPDSGYYEYLLIVWKMGSRLYLTTMTRSSWKWGSR
jgi:hypothetical protein